MEKQSLTLNLRYEYFWLARSTQQSKSSTVQMTSNRGLAPVSLKAVWFDVINCLELLDAVEKRTRKHFCAHLV